MAEWVTGGYAPLVMAAGFIGATGALTRLAQQKCAVRIHWRRVAFAVTLFWFWYLAPAALESRALVQVFDMLR